MSTKLKSVFLSEEIKRIIELNLSLRNLTTRSESLENILKESPRFIELKKMLDQFKDKKPVDTFEEAKKQSEELLG